MCRRNAPSAEANSTRRFPASALLREALARRVTNRLRHVLPAVAEAAPIAGAGCDGLRFSYSCRLPAVVQAHLHGVDKLKVFFLLVFQLIEKVSHEINVASDCEFCVEVAGGFLLPECARKDLVDGPGG